MRLKDPANKHFVPLLPSGITVVDVHAPTEPSIATMLDNLASFSHLARDFVFFSLGMDVPNQLVL
jgi:hypothetical protein